MVFIQENFVQSFVHLKDFPDEHKALDTLKRVASLVKPIMRRHGWKISRLAEFYPEQANLWGLNTSFPGSTRLPHIQLRLRDASSVHHFLDYESVVQTMLHELTHCQFGPHDDKFWRMYHSLQDELDTLRIGGFTGEGFLGEGKQLGGVPRGLRQRENLVRAREAEQRRKKEIEGRGRVLSSGGFGPFRWSIEEEMVPTRGNQQRPTSSRTVSMPPSSSSSSRQTTLIDKELSPYATAQQLAAYAALQRQKVAGGSAGESSRSPSSSKPKTSLATPQTQGCPGTRTADTAEIDRETALMHGFTTVAEMEDANERAIMQAAIELLEEADKEDALKQDIMNPYTLPSSSSSSPSTMSAPHGSTPSLARTHSDPQVRQQPPTKRSKPDSVVDLTSAPSPSKLSKKPLTTTTSSNTTTPNIRQLRRHPPTVTNNNHDDNNNNNSPPTPSIPSTIPKLSEWSCKTCTFLNPSTHLQCICGDVRPDLDGDGSRAKPRGSGSTVNSGNNTQSRLQSNNDKDKTWTCHRCSTCVSHEWWSCTRCGCMKLES